MSRTNLAIIVPSYDRPESLQRLITSVRLYASDAMLVVVWQDDESPPPGADVAILMPPGLPGPRRHAGVLGVKPYRPDAYLFVDDDHELLPAFATDTQSLLAATMAGMTGVIVLPVHPTARKYGVRWACMNGGLLVRAAAYEASGGFGEDYLDEVELTLRVSWAGYTIERWPRVVSTHHRGIPGGLGALRRLRPEERSLRVSRLPERYPERLEKANTWLGFKERS